MIAAWMLYCVAIGLLFVVLGEALERALHLAGRATRWAWVAALAGSYLVPAAALLRPSAFAALPVPLAQPVVAELPATAMDQRVDGALPKPGPSFSLGDLDTALARVWGLSSAALLLSLGAAALRLAALRRGWRSATVDGRAVLVSDNVGPAVAGLWRSRIVLPDWALRLGEGERRLMLAHEDEHVRARDPWLLVAAAAAVVLAPWNPVLWWQVRRLSLAVEMDCDARVLARHGDAPAYGALLLRVGRRRARLPLGAPALGEPASFLARRIRRMVTALPRWRWAGVAVGTAVAAAALVTACDAPRPVATEAAEQVQLSVPFARPNELSATTEALLWTFRDPTHRVANRIIWLVLDAKGTVVASGPLPRQPQDTVLDALGLARRIPGYDTLAVGHIVLRAERGSVPTISVQVQGPGGPPAVSPERRREMEQRSAYVRQAAGRYHPEVFAHPHAGAAIALVFDPQGSVVGHAAGVREARDADCLAVVKRLVPKFATGQPSQSGCAGVGAPGHAGEVVVYWMWLLRLPTS